MNKQHNVVLPEYLSHKHSIKIVESVHLYKETIKTKRRSWRERLFSRPWNPLKRTKVVCERRPDPNFYFVNGLFVGHPETVARFRDMVDGKVRILDA